MKIEIRKDKNTLYNPKLINLELFRFVFEYWNKLIKNYPDFNQIKETLRIDNFLGLTQIANKNEHLVIQDTSYSKIINVIQKSIFDQIICANKSICLIGQPISWIETIFHNCNSNKINVYLPRKNIDTVILKKKLLEQIQEIRKIRKNSSTILLNDYSDMNDDNQFYNIIVLDIFYQMIEDLECPSVLKHTENFKYFRSAFIHHNDFLLRNVEFALNHLELNGDLVLMFPGVTTNYCLNIIQLISHFFHSKEFIKEDSLFHRDQIIFSTSIVFKQFKGIDVVLELQPIYDSPKEIISFPPFLSSVSASNKCSKVPTISFLELDQNLIKIIYDYNNKCLIDLYNFLSETEYYVLNNNMMKQFISQKQYFAIMIASDQNIPIKTKYSKKFFNNLLEIILDQNNQKFLYEFNMKEYCTISENYKKQILLRIKYFVKHDYHDSISINNLIKVDMVNILRNKTGSYNLNYNFFEYFEILSEFFNFSKVCTNSIDVRNTFDIIKEPKKLQNNLKLYFYIKKSGLDKAIILNPENLILKIKLSYFNKTYIEKFINLIKNYKHIKFVRPQHMESTSDKLYVVLNKRTKTSCTTESLYYQFNKMLDVLLINIRYLNTNQIFFSKEFLNEDLSLRLKLRHRKLSLLKDWFKQNMKDYNFYN